MSKIKICHVIGNFVNGGVEAVIYNYFSHIDMEKYEVHIIGHGIRVQECADRFVSLGFKIHKVFLLLEVAKRWKQFLEMSNLILFIHI